MKENQLLNRTRFKKEKYNPGYTLAEGSWESVLAGVRDFLPEDVHTTGEGDVFLDVDKKVTMGLGAACFQYYMAGKGHITLAEKVIDSFSQMRAGAASVESKKDIVKDLASKLYDYYPESYRKSVKR